MDDRIGLPLFDPDLAQRLHNALTAGNEELFRVITDPAMEVLNAVLKNPLLDEAHLLILLKRRDLTEKLLKSLQRLPQVTESHKLKVALVHNPNTPEEILLSLLPQLFLFELATVLFLPGIAPDLKYATERAIILRLTGTPLGNKITLARRGTSGVVGALLKEGDPVLVAACLANPRLREVDILQFLNGPTATAETISTVARHNRWQSRLNLKLAILKNQKTPLVWHSVFLPTLPLNEIKNLLTSRSMTGAAKREVGAELKQRGLR